MAKKEKSIDTYIAKSAAFAIPILTHIRELIHKTCPDVQEKMKWSFPHFDYKDEMMCSMAAFKQHCAFSFWKGSLMKDKSLDERARSQEAMGHLGRILSLKDLPPDKKMVAYIKEAMQLNEQGIKLPARQKNSSQEPLIIPDHFTKALKKNKKAAEVFEKFAYSHRKEYLQWITEAKTEVTRDKRIAQAIEWLQEGKNRNWKYERK